MSKMINKMNRAKTTVFLALRNLTRQKRRSFMLALAIGFGFFVVTAIDGLASGAVDCLEDQISQLNGGNVFIQGVEHLRDEDGNLDKKYNAVIRDADFIENLINENHIEHEYYSHRTSSAGTIIFNNKKIIGNISGCDFSKEDYLLNSLIIIDGKLENVFKPHALIISQKNAEALNLQIGDTVLYSTTTISNQKNVGEFTVQLIIKDPSLISSLMIYAPIDEINELVGIPKGGYTNFSIGLKDKSRQNLIAQALEDEIRKSGNSVTSRLEAYKASPTNPTGQFRKQLNNMLVDGTLYTAFSMNDAVPQLKTVVTVVHSVTTSILLVILLIVMVGISNTYRMILYERIREIGTMRAVGMTGKQSGNMFTTEAVILSLIGAVAGFILATIVMFLVSRFSIQNESLSFFLRNGHLTYLISPGSMIGKYVLMIILTILAVRNTAKNAASLSPANALRSSK